MVTTKICLQNKVIKRYGTSQRALQGKTTEQNSHNKVETINECHACNQKERESILCLNQKFEFASYKGENLLNKITKILGTCRHKNKYKFKHKLIP